MGTERTFCFVIVSTSAVMDIPGLSVTPGSTMRIFTVKFVTSSCVPRFFDVPVFAISYTTAFTFLSGKASMEMRAVSPTWTRMTSFSLTSTCASIFDRSATVITFVPWNCCVPRTRSPSWLFNWLIVPSIGEVIVVFLRLSSAWFRDASACAYWALAPS